MINKKIKNKLGQEEMVGFALIIIMVAIILLVFLTISMKKTNEMQESAEIENFVQSMLEYTTTCSMNSNYNYISIDRLIQECSDEAYCKEGTFSCDVLNETLKEMISIAWPIEENSQFKAYELIILQGVSPEVKLLTNLSEGIKANSSSKGASQDLVNNEKIYLTIYY